MKKTLKFTVGQRVDYILCDTVYFTGTITEAEVKRGLKPYTLVTDEGVTKYANEEFLSLPWPKKTYVIKVEANERVNKSEEFTVEAVDRIHASREALNKCKMNTRLMRIFLDGVELFFNDSKPVRKESKVSLLFKEKGFYSTDTGGGCEAYRKDLENGAYLLVTKESNLPTKMSDAVTVGFYDGREEDSVSYACVTVAVLFKGSITMDDQTVIDINLPIN